MEIIKFEEWKKNRLKRNEQSLRDLWDIVKWSDVHMGVREGDDRKGRREYLKK